MTMRRALVIIVLLGWASSHNALADPPSTASRESNLQAVQERYQQRRLLHGDDPNFLVRPGLLANKAERWVRVDGAHTGLGEHEPVEFFLISQTSGKDYEALVVSYAKPSDIDQALRFIGLPPGRPVNYNRLHFWPKGERVFMTFHWVDPEGHPRSARAIEFLNQPQDQRALTDEGLVYVGSITYPHPADPQRMIFAADHGEPGSIASTYNEPTTVLDVPGAAVQSEVYRLRMMNPQYVMPQHHPIEVVLTPEPRQHAPRVADVVLSAAPSEPDQPAELKDVRFLLQLDAAPPGQPLALAEVLAALVELVQQHREPFVRVDVDPVLPLRTLRQLFAVLDTLEQAGVRLEPPKPGFLFHRAFLPDERLRAREDRLYQPFEIHLKPDKGRIDATFVQITEPIVVAGDARELTVINHPAPTPDTIAARLKEIDDPNRPLAVFAPADLSYATLLEWIRPAMGVNGPVFVFLE